MGGRGRTWIEALIDHAPQVVAGTSTVLYGDAPLGDEAARFIAVVPDPNNRFARARAGEVGLDEAWGVAALVCQTLSEGRERLPRPIVAIVDVTSQAYGRKEELLGIHLACAAAADAYASARLAGHPVIALLVGKAMSGAFLAHGYQANRILALEDPGVLVHAMGREAAARVTRRTVQKLDQLAERVVPMSYRLADYHALGLLSGLIRDVNADAPTAEDVMRVRQRIAAAVLEVRASRDVSLACRLTSPGAQRMRAASILVRRRIAEQWDAC